ncbi:MAG: hypothetical protein ACO31D_06215 [Ilumatobacteraceae bacterium]
MQGDAVVALGALPSLGTARRRLTGGGGHGRPVDGAADFRRDI